MKMTFNFKIDIAEYAKRFGISIPDDSSDVITDDGDGKGNAKGALSLNHDGGIISQDEFPSQWWADAVAEDANVSYAPGFAPGSLAGQCQATLQQCKAKNPMTCRYHGAQVIANDIESELKYAGVNAPVDVKLLGITNTGGKQLMSVAVTIKANPSDQEPIERAMGSFFMNSGVYDGFTTTMNGKYYESDFDIDLLNANARARWGAGQRAPQQTQQTQQPAAAAQPVSTQQNPTQVPEASVQPKSEKTGTPAEATAIPVSQKPRPTRKRVKKPAEHSDSDVPKKDDASVAEKPAEPVDIAGVDVDLDSDAPTLYPDQAPPKPPDWNPPFTQQELSDIGNMTTRILKTARQINNHIEKGTTETWIQSKSPNLPGSLQKFKSQVDGNAFKALAEKDTTGQLKPFADLFDEISKSEANGWKDKVAESIWDPNAQAYWEQNSNKAGNVDLHFDPNKYADPYAKERAAYEAYIPGDKGRDTSLDVAKQVEDSSSKDAPKDAAKDAKDAAKEMSDLEDGFRVLADSPKQVLKTLAQAYHKANEKFKDGVAKCKKWLDGQSVMKGSIRETIEAMKERGEKIPEEMNNWESIEASVEDAAWRTVASDKGFNVADKMKHLAIYKKNMRALFSKCPCVSGYNINHVISHILNRSDHTLHAHSNSYVIAANAAFGTNWAKHSADAANGMHTYSKVFSSPFSKMNLGSMYNNGPTDVGLLMNPKKAVISYVHQYTSSVYAVSSHPNGSNATFVNDATFSGVANNVFKVKREMFTQDLSNLPMSKIQTACGLGENGGEAWAVGGLRADQCLAIRECGDRKLRSTPWNTYFSQTEIDRLNGFGVTVLDIDGNVVGKDCVPEDPDLEALVWGKKGRPKS